jgi:hypothetical protein
VDMATLWDTSDLSDPRLLRDERASPCRMGRWFARHIALTPDYAVLSLGHFGARLWPLTGP